MIHLNKHNVYDFDKHYQSINDNLFKFYPLLSTMKKPLIEDILKYVKGGKINLMYATDNDDVRFIVLSKDKKKVYVNASDLSTDIDRDVNKGSINLGYLYSLMIQGYTLLQWEESLSKNRELLAQSLEAYGEMWIKVATNKGLGMFDSPDIKRKYLFLVYSYVLYKSDTAVSDKFGYAARVAKYTDYEVLVEKYKDSYSSDMELEQFLVNVLQIEFSFFKKIEESKDIVYIVFRLFGPTAAQMIDDLAYYPVLAVDFVQTASLLVYKNYAGLINIIDKKSFTTILSTISDY